MRTRFSSGRGSFAPGVHWGRTLENGVWWATRSKTGNRFLWTGHDSLFVAIGRFRIRIMKPRRFR